MKVVNIAQQQAYEHEKAQLKRRHDEALKELEAQRPKPLMLKQVAGGNGDDGGPVELEHGIVALPGTWHGVDTDGTLIVIHPEDIGEGRFWLEVK
jgi:hypothetical protein